MSISDQAGGSVEASGRRHTVEARPEESEKYEEAEGDQETEGAGEGDGDGKDGEQRARNVAAAAATQKAAVDTHDRTAAAKSAKTKTSAQEPSAPHAEPKPASGANVGVGTGTGDTGDEDSNVPRHTLSELLTWPVLTLAHEVVRLEGALDDSIQAQYDADHALKLQRNRIRGLLNDLQVQKDNLDAAITRTGNIATRFQEAEEKWARTVEGLVQELRVERGSATVQREAADRTLRRLEDTMVGLRALIADSISDAVARTRYEMAPWGRMGTFEAGVATAADRGGGGIRMVTGPLRFETAEATGSEDRGVKRPSGLPTPRSPSPPPKKAKGSSEQPEAREPGRGSLAQKSKTAGATVNRPSPIASGTGGPPAAGGAAIQQAGVPLMRGAEEIPDADAEATEAMQTWIRAVMKRVRTLKDENAEASDEVACSAAVGLETVADDSPAKGKKFVPSGAGSVAFVCAVSWMQCKGCDLKTAEASAKQAALLAGASDLSVVLYLAVWKHIVTAAKKGHDAAKIELQVAKHFADAKKATVTKSEKSTIHEQVDVLRTWNFDPDAAKKMRALGLYIECGDDRAKAKNRDVSRSRERKSAAKSDDEGGSHAGKKSAAKSDDEGGSEAETIELDDSKTEEM
ncbi:unnamed protein product [Closterium sp. Naga37s-1]|nr:unnamed protein product [Closterium sp. Naga37s-1]